MNKKRILLVDDEKDMVFVLKLHLEAEGYDVLTAFDGQEALQKARQDQPDLIILDVMLPKLDGYKVCRMLKFDRKYKAIPVVMLTAKSQEGDVKLGYEVGADFYVTKPFESKTLLLKVKDILEGKTPYGPR